MRYISTRGGVEPLQFQNAVLMGLADDGGLIIPESIPDAGAALDGWRDLPYAELAAEVMGLFATDMPREDLRELARRTYGDAYGGPVAPTVGVGPYYMLELWHGATLAFKDVALQFLGNLFEYFLSRTDGRLNILGATSGDTGSAAIHGCRGRERIHIFILHPHGAVSEVQRRQMTTVLDENVHNLAIEGSFDDCQRIVKSISCDLQFKDAYALGAVNSINWARVMAQIVYYFKGCFDVQRTTGAERVSACVPTGNFGNVLAGWYAMKMGAPIARLILATNENDILARFFNTGRYVRGTVTRTPSPAMDIQAPSNFERYLYYLVGRDHERVCELMETFRTEDQLQMPTGEHGVDPDFVAGACDMERCLETIRRYYDEHDYLLDPHTAVGVAVAEERDPGDAPTLCVATAHPAKFPDAVERAVGEDVAHHPAIDALMDLPERCTVLPDDEAAVRDFIQQNAG